MRQKPMGSNSAGSGSMSFAASHASWASSHLPAARRAFAKRALPPIGALKALVNLDIELLLQDVPQTGPLSAEGAAGDAWVEEIIHLEPEIARQASDVVRGGGEDLLDLGIREDWSQTAQVGEGQGIDQVIGAPLRELRERHGHAVGVKAVGL